MALRVGISCQNVEQNPVKFKKNEGCEDTQIVQTLNAAAKLSLFMSCDKNIQKVCQVNYKLTCHKTQK